MGCVETRSCEPQEDEADGVKEKFLDRYDLHEVIGQGAFGVVHRASSRSTGQDFAVKMVDCVETSRTDIDREVAMMRKLIHPSVVRIYDVFPERVFVCLVLELHKGGDMIQGMVNYWKKEGMIPIPAMRSLSKQMWESVTWVHSKGCVHRDIKGDNFMMDLKDVSNLSNKIYLSDFGTVCEISPRQRLSHKCGTSNYWPPEFFDLKYGQKVDVWATGVVMYGLVSGKFPFKSERDTRTKSLHVPRRCPSDGIDLIQHALERNEDARYTAAQALAHGFFAGMSTSNADAAEAGDDEKGISWSPSVRERGANGGVQLRRAELVNRLKTAQSQKFGRQLQRRSSGLCRLREKQSRGFVVEDGAGQRTTTYEWWSGPEASRLTAEFRTSPRLLVPDITPHELSSEDIAKMLQDHNVSLEGFGRAGAKSFEEFASEVRRGALRLQLDASKHKHIVCVMDVVFVRLRAGEGPSARYLVCTSELSMDTQVRKTRSQMPSVEKRPQENPLQAAARLLSELGYGDMITNFDINGISHSEAHQDSAAYAGIQIVCLNEFMNGVVSTADPSFLRRGGGEARFTCEDPIGRRSRSYAWLTEAECSQANLEMETPPPASEYSALVYPPIGLEEDELSTYLANSRIDTRAWGTGTARSIAEFADELVKGEATLQKMPNGQVKRVVDVVVMELVMQGSGSTLIERDESKDNSVKELKRLPAIKRRSDEHQFLAARRLLTGLLTFNENYCYIDPSDVRIVEQETSSVSYPGLPTVYRKRFMKARVVQEVFHE